MSQAASASIVHWNAWHADAFARAGRERRPVLLSLVATWSAGCREMDRTTFADAGIAAAINEQFVPVRVDADERPDIADRYELGGLPTTAFLSPEGHLLGGGTFTDATRLGEVLRLVPAALARFGEPPERHEPAQPPPSRPSAPSSETEIEATLWAASDHENGGFGGAPKFPHAAAVRLAFQLHADRADAGLLAAATLSLDAMGWGELFDLESGGFFRCCAGVDWTDPQRELLLGVNASLLDLYLDAAESLPLARYRARAGDVARFLDTQLRRQDGAWRLAANPPASRVFTDANARAASALLRAARVLDDTSLGTRAIAGLEQVLLASYKPGEGLSHYPGGPRGLLTDHAAMMHATLDAWEETGNIVYRMMAEELTHYAVRTMWDGSGAGFFDRAPALFAAEPAGAARVLKPFVLNCETASALHRLAEAVNDGALAVRAAAVLDAMSPMAAAQGADAAHYLLARRAILR